MNVSWSIRNIVSIILLTASWCALWRTVSIANIAGGLGLAMLLTFSGLGPPGRGKINVLGCIKLFGFVLVDLIKSTIDVAKEVITPGDNTNEAVIGIELEPEALDHLLFMTLAITLTPGTAVVDADTDEAIVYVHSLDGDVEGTTAGVHKLADLVCQAFPTRLGQPTVAGDPR